MTAHCSVDFLLIDLNPQDTVKIHTIIALYEHILEESWFINNLKFVQTHTCIQDETHVVCSLEHVKKHGFLNPDIPKIPLFSNIFCMLVCLNYKPPSFYLPWPCLFYFIQVTHWWFMICVWMLFIIFLFQVRATTDIYTDNGFCGNSTACNLELWGWMNNISLQRHSRLVGTDFELLFLVPHFNCSLSSQDCLQGVEIFHSWQQIKSYFTS